MTNLASPPLLNVLGASWDFGAPVVAAAWGSDGRTAAFALGDGHVALVDTHWPRGPQVERRTEGGLALTPAESPAPRPVRALCHQGATLCLVAEAQGGFLSAGDDGRIVQLPHAGDPKVLAQVAGAWITAVACNAHGVRAYAHGRRVQRMAGARRDAIDLPAPATALSFGPDGGHLAIAHMGGATLWADAGEVRCLEGRGYPRSLAWSPDGRYLMAGLQENALRGWRVADGSAIEMGGYPGQPLSLAFAHDGRWLATSGGLRPVCWRFDPPGANDAPAECGIPSRTPVTCVSTHPRQPLIAAGYHHGALLLVQPGSDEALIVKGSGQGEVNALAWSGDGTRLAFGTQDGSFGWVGLPAALFHTRRQGAPQETHLER